MVNKFNIDEWADKFVNNELSEHEISELNKILNDDIVLQKEWNASLDILAALKHAGAKHQIQNAIADLHTPPSFKQKTTQFIKQNWKASAIAASFAIATLTGVQYLNSSKELGDSKHKFTQLSRDIENIKHSQKTILKTIEGNNTPAVAQPEYQMGGTGFALSNDGYIATNYHVVKDATHIAIQTQNLNSFDATLVGYDALSDLAILKVTDKHFKFGKQQLPYSIKKNNGSALGLKIFSIGYPQENLVYNEGYVSCERGYQGDSLSYQLEIVSNPGQSGSPILDKNGNIWGLINGKSSNTYGTTYAVKSNALIDLVKNMPNHIKLTLPQGNSISKLDRTNQVEILKDYIVTIKTSK